MKDWHWGIYTGRSGTLGDGIGMFMEAAIGLAQFSVVFAAAAGVGLATKHAGLSNKVALRKAGTTFLGAGAAMLLFNQYMNCKSCSILENSSSSSRGYSNKPGLEKMSSRA